VKTEKRLDVSGEREGSLEICHVVLGKRFFETEGVNVNHKNKKTRRRQRKEESAQKPRKT